MSFKHTAAAIEAEGLTHTEKLVLIVLSEYADAETGACWPSREAVARKAMISADTVGRICSSLRTKGFLSIRPRFRENGSRTSNEVIILPRQVAQALPPADTPPTEDRVPPDAGSGTPPTEDRGQNLSDNNLDSLSDAQARDWREFGAGVTELTGEAIDPTAPAIISAYPLWLLLQERPGSPACNLAEVNDGVMRAAAWFLKRHGPGKMVNWDTAVRMALESRDRRIAGHPVKAQPPPAKTAGASTLGDPRDWPVDRWKSAIGVALRNGQWPPNWGPEPGVPGSFVPAELVELWKGRAA